MIAVYPPTAAFEKEPGIRGEVCEEKDHPASGDNGGKPMEDKNLSKHIPNWITALRLAGAAGLLLCRPLSAGFFVLYILCGLSDGLDGAAARKWNAATPAGAAFDSAADAAFAASALWVLLPLLRMQTWMLIWLAGIALLRTVSVTVGWIRFRAFACLHTWSNKAAGLLLFGFPVLWACLGMTFTALLLGCTASLSAVEELAIHLTADRLDRDRKSVFIR